MQCRHKLSVARNLQLLLNYLGPAVRISVLPTFLPCRKHILRVQTRLDDEMVNILVARDEKEREDGQRKQPGCLKQDGSMTLVENMLSFDGTVS